MSVAVLIDEKPVEMYQTEISGNKISCWIESVEGKEFKTQSKLLKSFSPYGVSFFIDVDGTRMGGIFDRTPQSSGIFDGPYTSANTKQPLVFSKINLTDDTEIASHDEKFIKNLGSITLECHRGIEVKMEQRYNADLSGFSGRAVDERSKKAQVSHQVGLGQAKPVAPSQTVKVDYIDTLNNPYAIFEIKYRSRALLELDDIVKPRVTIEDTPPVPAASTSGPSTDQTNKKRKATSDLKVDKDGAIVISDNSDGEEQAAVEVKKEKKVKKEEEGEKVVLEID
ncbi:hypothetical protein JCM5350_005268 [Sporobolomyces pararoseus]